MYVFQFRNIYYPISQDHIKEKRKQVTVKLNFFPLFCDKQMQAHAQFMLVCDGSQCHIGIVMTVL